VLGVGMDQLLSSPDVDVLATDVQLVPNVAVVCDGHDLPFVDGSFDGVICQAVLEHVLDPQRVADEIWRVLSPDGLVYSEVPFLWPVHAGAFDFMRFTHLGHRRMWRRFDEISSGADNGPGVALGLSIWYFVTSIAPRRLRPLTTRLVSLFFFWLKELDPWLVKRPASLDAAAGTFFLGSRREAPLEDREIVNGYRGANGPRPYLALPHRAGN
jgi:SAM-dependent methyltransferase